MADLVRASLFALSLGTVLFSSLVLVGPLRSGAAGTLLALWVVGAGQVVLLAEVLSLLDALDWTGFLVGHLLTFAATMAWMLCRPCADRWRAPREIRAGLCGLVPIVWDWRAPWLPILAGATLLTGVISTVVALRVPPNNVDSLAYHMPRVGYYLQFRSLDHYPTLNLFQVVHPANAELLILWTAAFLRADRLANTVQLAAWVMAVAAVYGLGRQAGFAPRAALLGAGVFALLPQPVLQSSSAHNDLVVASFVAAGLFFVLQAARAPRPVARLALAGAAVGLAVGTKGTALLALPGLAGVFLLLFARRPWRQILAGVLAGGLMVALLGSYVYVQNWYLYDSPFGSPLIAPLTRVSFPATREGLASNLARTMYAFAFADLSGPLADPRAAPVAAPLARAHAALGRWLFAALAIPVGIGGIDDDGVFPPFRFTRRPTVDDYASGVGPTGGLIMVLAAATLVWPGRVPVGRRLLGLATLSYLIVMSLTLAWSPFGGGRFLVTACALGAPLVGLVATRPGPSRQALALALALWSGATGLYVAWFSHDISVSQLSGQDRLTLTFPRLTELRAFFREVDQEVGREAVVGIYGSVPTHGVGLFPEYPLFGTRFTRTLVPLVDPHYAERIGLRRSLAWSNESVLAARRPRFLVVHSRRSGAEELPGIIPGRCARVPLRHGKPTIPWELWRCDDWGARDSEKDAGLLGRAHPPTTRAK